MQQKSLFLLCILCLLAPSPAKAQLDNNFAGGGGIKIGDSTTTCTGNAGALRYDLDSSDGGGLQYCDGTTWTGILPSSFAGVVNNGNSFAAPMIIGTNDANSLALETNGTTRMTIDTSGNVGIGTTTPLAELDVSGTGALVVPRGTSLEQPGTPANGMIRYNTDNNKFEAYENSAWTNMIGSGGGSGDFLADGSVPMTAGLQLADGLSSTPGLTFASNTDTGIFLSSTNRVNFTTDGTAQFTFASGYLQGAGVSGSPKILRDAGSAAAPAYSFKVWSAMGMYASADNELSFSTSGTEALRIDASSQVGIGSSTPKATLDVNGDVKIGNSSATCSATTAGSIRYNSGIEYCDGTTWQVVGGGLVGKVSMDGASNCEWYVSSTSWTTPSVDADCNAQTLTGSALAPTEGKIPAIRFTNLPAGDYELVLNLNMFTNNASDTCHFILYDGTSRSGYAYTYYGDQNNLIGQFSYSTTQSDITFYVQAKRGGSNGCWLDNSAGQKFEIWLKKI